MATAGKITEKLTENKTKGVEVRVYCPECNREQNHIVVVSADMDWSQDFSEDCWISSEDNYQVIQCKCGHLSFRHSSWFSEYEDHDSSGRTEKIYPELDADSLPVKDFKSVPDIVCRIYEETIKALNNECLTLCAGGLRGIVEGICADKAVKSGLVEQVQKDGSIKMVRSKHLDGKISGLCEKGILTKKRAEALHEHRFLGNEAVHQLAQPSMPELKLAIEIIEHTLEELYELPEKADALKRKRTARVSRKKIEVI
jgi:hypothetical protein